MSMQDDFKAFLSDIEPSTTTVNSISSAHSSLRGFLEKHDEYSAHCANTYLSGSYAKHTAIRPAKDNDNRDVDIIIETDYTTDADPADVIIELRDALLNSSKYQSAHLQSHSIGITMQKLDIDVVPLAVGDGKTYIGCIDDGSWNETDPKGHKEWSTETNDTYNGRYKPVVKIMKWWRHQNCPEGIRWPKGITLEKIIADCYPSELTKYEDILFGLLQNIVDQYSEDIDLSIIPFVEDPKVSGNDLSFGYALEDYESFLQGVKNSLKILQDSGSCNQAWRDILGDRFPASKSSSATSALTLSSDYMPVMEALQVSHKQKPKWPIAAKHPRVIIVADVEFPNGKTERIASNDMSIPKGCNINYQVLRSQTLANLKVEWQIVNTGQEAYQAQCPRGEFCESNLSKGGRHEETAYRGRHYVQAFLIKRGRCVAFSKEFFINVE